MTVNVIGSNSSTDNLVRGIYLVISLIISKLLVDHNMVYLVLVGSLRNINYILFSLITLRNSGENLAHQHCTVRKLLMKVLWINKT